MISYNQKTSTNPIDLGGIILHRLALLNEESSTLGGTSWLDRVRRGFDADPQVRVSGSDMLQESHLGLEGSGVLFSSSQTTPLALEGTIGGHVDFHRWERGSLFADGYPAVGEGILDEGIVSALLDNLALLDMFGELGRCDHLVTARALDVFFFFIT